jgi:hypothetical protein
MMLLASGEEVADGIVGVRGMFASGPAVPAGPHHPGIFPSSRRPHAQSACLDQQAASITPRVGAPRNRD